MTVSGRNSGAAEPRPSGLGLSHELGRSLRVTWDGAELARYVYAPWDAQRESPRPYLHPVRTLGGDLVSLCRPHDHVWHKGIAWSLPNIQSAGGDAGEHGPAGDGPAGDGSGDRGTAGESTMRHGALEHGSTEDDRTADGPTANGPTANFWGGSTYLHGRGYVQLANNGTMRHRAFDQVELEGSGDARRVRVAHTLDWVTQQGETWVAEARALGVTVHPDVDAWSLVFQTHIVNAGPRPLVIGSPTTQGRENAGYGGLFWRGPRSFTGGRVHVPGTTGADELMGTRQPWLAFTGEHDGHGRSSTVAFVDAPDNPGHPVRWFVRSAMYACACPAPFFSAEVPLAPGASLRLRYAVVVADGDRGSGGAARLAEAGLAALAADRWHPAPPAPAPPHPAEQALQF